MLFESFYQALRHGVKFDDDELEFEHFGIIKEVMRKDRLFRFGYKKDIDSESPEILVGADAYQRARDKVKAELESKDAQETGM